MSRFKQLMEAGAIRRFHTVHVHRQQTIGEHSWGVCMILCRIKPPLVSTYLLQKAMYHDLAEIVTGDIPAPAKWGSEGLTKALRDIEDDFHYDTGTYIGVTKEEDQLLRWADNMELMIYAHSEVKSGNGHMLPVFDRIKNRIATMGFPTREAQSLFEEYQYV